MANISGLLALLQEAGLPVAYHHWIEPPAAPYLVYLFIASSDLIADNRNYAQRGEWEIELYTELKDPVSEGLVEEVLRGNEIPYEKRETFIDSEGLYQISYGITY